MNAKIFLSCGQSAGSDEPVIAEKIGARLREHGFECYVAIGDQSISGLRENIFRQLGSSEYFVFVDFKREKILSREGVEEFRGSLFSHQELAIASHLELPCLVFQERGVRPRDGMLIAFQANPVEFSDRSMLPSVVSDLVAQKIQRKEWCTTWKNGLSLAVAAKPFGDAQHAKTKVVLRHYHVAVTNQHRAKLALNCFVVLESVENLDTRERMACDSIELKWAGSTLPSVFVAPSSVRRFDAFKVDFMFPSVGQFNVPWCDSTEFYPVIRGPGRFRITYAVCSSTFPTCRRAFDLTLTDAIDTLTFEPAPA